MSVGHIQASLLDGGQRQRRLGLDPAAQQLQGPNPLVEFGIGGVEQLVGDVVDRAVAPPDRVAQRPQIHTTIMTKGCHRDDVMTVPDGGGDSRCGGSVYSSDPGYH